MISPYRDFYVIRESSLSVAETDRLPFIDSALSHIIVHIDKKSIDILTKIRKVFPHVFWILFSCFTLYNYETGTIAQRKSSRQDGIPSRPLLCDPSKIFPENR